MKKDLLCLENFNVKYSQSVVIENLSLRVDKGDVLGILGESGSGKSSLLKAILDPIPFGISVEGTILYKGSHLETLSLTHRQMLKGVGIAFLCQNPYDTFNPIRSIKKQFKETLKSHNLWRGKETIKEIILRLESFGLNDGEKLLEVCPYTLSGGMNQRIAIVLATMLAPDLLLADEPTSALDAISQSQVIDTLQRLKEKEGTTMIIVSHNLNVIESLCDHVVVMYKGKIIETGTVSDVLKMPKQLYTKQLIKAVPKIIKGERDD